MHKQNHWRFTAGAAAMSAALAAQAQVSGDVRSGAPEEVVVTGSFIRRSEGFTPSSPVQDIGKEEFEAHAPKTVADFLTTLPYSFNTTFTVGRALGSSNGSGSLNLRNLGADATLVLLNSRRVARDPVTVNNVDVNALLPQIAIERIEILKDGASSLYGSDAVGGVANFLTRRNFDGMEFSAQADMREEGSTTDYRVSGIWGAQSDTTSIIVAAEYFSRERYYWESFEVISDRAGTIDGEFRLPGWPARYTVPNRNAAGAIAGAATTLADPLCALFTGANTPAGTVARQGVNYPTTCVQNVPIGTAANADESRYQAFAELHHEFSPGFKFFGEVGLLRTRTAIADTPGAAVNPAPGAPNVIIPGYAPSNTFRAVDAAGVPLYAQSSGVQLNYDKNGDGINEFVPARGANGAVVVTGTNPAGGIPFWEDVIVAAGSRIFGLTCNLPGDPATTENCRNQINETRYAVDTMRFAGGFEGDIGGGWNYQAAYTYSANDEDDTTLGSAFSVPALRAALAGYGGDGCNSNAGVTDPLLTTVRPGQGNCQFFNIFGTSVTTQPGSTIANNESMVRYITAQDWSRFQATTNVADAVVSGPVFNLPAGPLSLAVGAQRRRESWSADYPTLQNQGQSDLQAAFYDKDVSQTANAVFAEIDVPLVNSDSFGTLDLSGALRYEDTEGPGLETTDPKIGLLYGTPGGMAKVRGTWGTSFLAPSLYQRYRQNVVFTNGVDDGLTPQNDNLGRVTTQIAGNPSLDPQTSENYNFGFTVEPFANLSIDVDYWTFKFEDQIAVENGLAVALDPVSALDPSKVIRSTSAGTVIVNGVNVGAIVGLNLTYVNNAVVETAGYDLGINYTVELGRSGTLRNGIQASYQDKYEVNGVGVTGSRNGRVTGASFAIPWRGTLRTDWLLGNHSVQSLLRYVDSYKNDVPPNAGTVAKSTIESYFSWDVSYGYALDMERFNLSSATVSLGVNNVLDEVPPWVPDGNHTLFTIYDYSGRHFWLRLKAQF